MRYDAYALKVPVSFRLHPFVIHALDVLANASQKTRTQVLNALLRETLGPHVPKEAFLATWDQFGRRDPLSPVLKELRRMELGEV